jgi:hypothetical protein
MLIRIEPIKAELQLNRIFQRCPTGEFHHLRSEELYSQRDRFPQSGMGDRYFTQPHQQNLTRPGSLTPE